MRVAELTDFAGLTVRRPIVKRARPPPAQARAHAKCGETSFVLTPEPRKKVGGGNCCSKLQEVRMLAPDRRRRDRWNVSSVRPRSREKLRARSRSSARGKPASSGVGFSLRLSRQHDRTVAVRKEGRGERDGGILHARRGVMRKKEERSEALIVCPGPRRPRRDG